jgi:hypothetical protein
MLSRHSVIGRPVSERARIERSDEAEMTLVSVQCRLDFLLLALRKY